MLSQRTRNTRNIHVESGKAPSRGRSGRGKRNSVAHMPREVQWLILALPLFPKTKDVRRSCSQRHRRVTGSADTHTVLSCTRKGTGPEMPGSVEPQLPSSITHHVPPDVSQPREATPHVRLSWHRPTGGLAGTMGTMGLAEPNMWSARVTLTQTREEGLLDHCKERNHEIRWAHRQIPRRVDGNCQ